MAKELLNIKLTKVLMLILYWLLFFKRRPDHSSAISTTAE